MSLDFPIQVVKAVKKNGKKEDHRVWLANEDRVLEITRLCFKRSWGQCQVERVEARDWSSYLDHSLQSREVVYDREVDLSDLIKVITPYLREITPEDGDWLLEGLNKEALSMFGGRKPATKAPDPEQERRDREALEAMRLKREEEARNLARIHKEEERRASIERNENWGMF